MGAAKMRYQHYVIDRFPKVPSTEFLGIAETAIAERTKDKFTIVHIKIKYFTTSKNLHRYCSEIFADLALAKDRSSIRA